MSAAERVVKQGFLQKLGRVVRGWRMRYFVLEGGQLNYYKKDDKKTKQGQIGLADCSVVAVSEDKYKKKFCFELQVSQKERVYAMSASSAQDMQDWIDQIQNVVISLQRVKSQDIREQQITALIKQQEQVAAAKRKITDESDESPHINPSPQPQFQPQSQPQPQSQSQSQSQPFSHREHKQVTFSSSDSQPKSPQNNTPRGGERYNEYANWLKETEDKRRKSEGAVTPILPPDDMDPYAYHSVDEVEVCCWGMMKKPGCLRGMNTC